jgi:tetratricopeptide (TPR) repeat protein
MSLDPYSLCPGGTGKKVKFCPCCQDILNELGKLQEQVQNGQIAAAFENARSLDARYPDRASILSYKTLLGWANRQPESVNESTARFLEKYPQNPVALAFQSMKLVREGQLIPALNTLQDSLEIVETDLPETVYNAMQLISQALLSQGHILPARGLLTLCMVISKAQDQTIMQMLMQLEGSPNVPVLLKDVPGYLEGKKDAPYRNEFDNALRFAGRGCWRKGVQIWESLLAKNPEDPAIWRNLAVARGYMGDYRASADAWRKYAELDVDADDEIEAEATAQLLRRDEAEGHVDDLMVRVGINDFEKLEQSLLANRRSEKLAVDMKQYAAEGQPPPRAIFAIYNKDRLVSAENLRCTDIPVIIAHAYLFGKETDRAARAEIDVYRTNLDAAIAALREIAGDALGGIEAEEITGKVSPLELALSWQWRLPENIDMKERMRLLRDQREHVLIDVWPTLKLPLLDNMTPAEASVDWHQRDRLQAAIMLLEVTDASQHAPVIFAKLRKKLGLPSPEIEDPATFDYKRARLPRFLYMPLEKLTDEQLRLCYERVMVSQFMPAGRRLAQEILKRDSLRDQLDLRISAYQVMIRVTEEPDEAIGYVDEARKLAEEHKESTAPWDLEELALRIARREANHVTRLIQHISQAHIREEGIADALFNILRSAGLIGPNGEMLGQPGAGSMSTADVDAASQQNKLWTPDGDSGGGEKKKSSLWVPE